jgi:hypothetical protein
MTYQSCVHPGPHRPWPGWHLWLPYPSRPEPAQGVGRASSENDRVRPDLPEQREQRERREQTEVARLTPGKGPRKRPFLIPPAPRGLVSTAFETGAIRTSLAPATAAFCCGVRPGSLSRTVQQGGPFRHGPAAPLRSLAWKADATSHGRPPARRRSPRRPGGAAAVLERSAGAGRAGRAGRRNRVREKRSRY